MLNSRLLFDGPLRRRVPWHLSVCYGADVVETAKLCPHKRFNGASACNLTHRREDFEPHPGADYPAERPPNRYQPFVSIPMGLVIGTAAFWTGFARLVVLATRLTADVMKGDHPSRALARMADKLKERGGRGPVG